MDEPRSLSPARLPPRTDAVALLLLAAGIVAPCALVMIIHLACKRPSPPRTAPSYTIENEVRWWRAERAATWK